MKTMPEIRIDRRRTLAEEPGSGQNRWHPDIPPVTRCEPGEEVILETRDAFDGQFGPETSLDVVGAPNLDVLHPLTGPVYIDGAEPGDLLDIEILAVESDRYGYAVQVPGFGFLRDVFPEPFKVDWDIAAGWATSADFPGVRVPGAPFMGTIGLSPGHELLAAITAASRSCSTVAGSCSPRRPRPSPERPTHRRRPSRRTPSAASPSTSRSASRRRPQHARVRLPARGHLHQ